MDNYIYNLKNAVKHLVSFLSLFFFLHSLGVSAQELPAFMPDIEQQLRNIDLPLVIIETQEGEDPTCDFIEAPDGCMGNGTTNREYVKGKMRIVKGQHTIYSSGNFVKNFSGIKIKVRGNSSAYTPCKSFKVKLQRNADLFFRGDPRRQDSDWALLNYYSTRDLKTVTGFKIGKAAGLEWEPAHRFVNLLLNGKYMGLYLLAETVRQGPLRCAVSADGYLIEADPYWWNVSDVTFHTEHLPYSMAYSFKYPDDKHMQTGERLVFISDYINGFEDALYGGGDISPYIDISSFASWMVAHDVLGTFDGCGSNIYLYKGDASPAGVGGTKLTMGPLWDFDSCFGCTDSWASSHTMPQFYFRQLFKRADFVDAYMEQWKKLRAVVCDVAGTVADSISTNYGEAIMQSRELTQVCNGAYSYVSVEENVRESKDWFASRVKWIDSQIGSLVEATSIHNPSSSSATEIVQADIYNLSGVLCYSSTGQDASRLFRQGVANDALPHGFYVVRVMTGNGMVETFKWRK